MRIEFANRNVFFEANSSLPQEQQRTIFESPDKVEYGFTPQARREIGVRDHWTCCGLEGIGCIHTTFSGEVASFQKGYMVCAAHYPSEHHHSGRGYHDTIPDRGRILCILDHAFEELTRGNTRGAQLQLEMGVYTKHDLEETGRQQWFPTIDELVSIFKERINYEDNIKLDLLKKKLDGLRSSVA